jgi:hypothetical protein
VLDADGSVLARSTLKVEVRAYEVWRETVESEFLSRVAAGEDPATQIEAYAGEGATRDGLALEPLPQPPTRQGASEAHYDGRIGLATLESPSGPGTWLRASLARGGEQALEADEYRVRGETRPAAGGAERERWDRDAARARRPHPYGDPVCGPLVCAVPGALFPDGVYLERDAALRYRAEDNLPRGRFPAWRSRLLSTAFWLRASAAREASGAGQTRRGSVSFWIKPAFDPMRAGRIRTLWSLDRNSSFSAESSVAWPPFGAYLFPCPPDTLPSEGPYRYGFSLEGLLGFGLGYQRAFDGVPAAAPQRDAVAAGIVSGRRGFDAFRPRRWVHVAFAWNFDLPVDRAFRMSVNGRLVPPGNAFEQVAGSLPLRGRVDFSRHGGEAPLVGPEPEREDVVVRRFNRAWPDAAGLLPALLGARRPEAHPDPSTWISFGALAGDRQRNFALDATVDEIRVGAWEDFEQARLDAADGRFARVDGPAAGGPRAGASFVSNSHRPPDPARPGSLAWTVRSASSLPDSAIRVAFWDGRRWRGPFDEPGGVTLAEPADAAEPAEFRYRATFTTGARRGTPILETPYLDDVTISYAAVPRVLSWSTLPESR